MLTCKDHMILREIRRRLDAMGNHGMAVLRGVKLARTTHSKSPHHAHQKHQQQPQHEEAMILTPPCFQLQPERTWYRCHLPSSSIQCHPLIMYETTSSVQHRIRSAGLNGNALVLNGTRVSLRWIERYMTTLMDAPRECVYFRVGITSPRAFTTKDSKWEGVEIDTSGDERYHPGVQVWPVHMPWMHKLAADLVLNRYHQTFGRGTPVLDWGVDTSVCQLHYMDTMITHAMLERMCMRTAPSQLMPSSASVSSSRKRPRTTGSKRGRDLLPPTPSPKRIRVEGSNSPPGSSTSSSSSSSSSDECESRMTSRAKSPSPQIGDKPAFKTAYVFDYPVYVHGPPASGRAWDGSEVPLAEVTIASLFESIYAVTRQHTVNIECDRSMYWPWRDAGSSIAVPLAE